MTTPIKKACDACHKRKIKCSGDYPCANCGQTNLQCTYLAIPRKKGPKGSRGKIISGIRNTQKDARPPSSAGSDDPGLVREPSLNHDSPLKTSAAFNVSLLSMQTVERCIEFFFANMTTTAWILDRAVLTKALSSFGSNPEIYCLIGSLSAFVLVQPGINLAMTPGFDTGRSDPPAHRYSYARTILDDVSRVRKGLDYIESPSLSSVQTSFFLFSCYFTLEHQNTCWFHLREAATLAHIMNMHDGSTYTDGNSNESMYKRRVYWLLLVTERAYAIERHRPLTLYPTIELPVAQSHENQHMICGFSYLIKLFSCIDESFMALWNKVGTECSAAWLCHLQQQLLDALPNTLETTESQIADVRVTQHWLRIMVWQLSIANGYLTTTATDVSLTFHYPVQIAKDLVNDIATLSTESMELHGIGLIEKLFDIACTLTDVVACVPEDTGTSGTDTSFAILNQLLNMISHLRGGSSRYLPLLLTKMSETLPMMTDATPRTFDPRRLSIIQGYAGASDNLPIPTPTQYSSVGTFGPEGFVFDSHYTMDQPVEGLHQDSRPATLGTFSPDSERPSRRTPDPFDTPSSVHYGASTASRSSYTPKSASRSMPSVFAIGNT